MSHATVKFTLPVLTTMYSAIKDIVYASDYDNHADLAFDDSMLPSGPCCSGTQLNPSHSIHPTE